MTHGGRSSVTVMLDFVNPISAEGGFEAMTDRAENDESGRKALYPRNLFKMTTAAMAGQASRNGTAVAGVSPKREDGTEGSRCPGSCFQDRSQVKGRGFVCPLAKQLRGTRSLYRAL